MIVWEGVGIKDRNKKNPRTRAPVMAAVCFSLPNKPRPRESRECSLEVGEVEWRVTK